MFDLAIERLTRCPRPRMCLLHLDEGRVKATARSSQRPSGQAMQEFGRQPATKALTGFPHTWISRERHEKSNSVSVAQDKSCRPLADCGASKARVNGAEPRRRGRTRRWRFRPWPCQSPPSCRCRRSRRAWPRCKSKQETNRAGISWVTRRTDRLSDCSLTCEAPGRSQGPIKTTY